MELKGDFNDLESDNLRNSVNFWKYLLSEHYILNSNSSENLITDSEQLKSASKNIFPPNVHKIKQSSDEVFEKILPKLKTSNLLSSKLVLVDNNELALQIKNLFTSTTYGKKGVLPEIHLITNYESYQAMRPVEKNSEPVISIRQRLMDIVEKIPSIDTYAEKLSLTTFELAAEWLKIIQRWEWLEEGWKILGYPKVENQKNKLELDNLEFLLMLRSAFSDKLNSALWHRKQFDLVTLGSPLRRVNVNVNSGVVMILTQIPDPLIIAKNLILARKKTTDWNIFIFDQPIYQTIKPKYPNKIIWGSWQENYDLIWPEVFNKVNKCFESRRKKLATNSNKFSKDWDLSGDMVPIRCVEVQSLQGFTDVLVSQITSWLNKNMNRIGIIALDRRVTRRLIAKLNHMGIEVDDSAGWSLNTSAVSLSVISLVKIISGKISNEDLFHWLNIPMIRRTLVKNNFFEDAAFIEITKKLKNWQPDRNPLQVLPTNLIEVIEQTASGSLSTKLIHTIKLLGIEEELLNDSAGRVVLSVCRKIDTDLANKDISSNNFTNLIEWEFAQHNFSVRFQNAKVILLNFQQAVWNPPDGLLVIGATDNNLPNITRTRYVDSYLWSKATASFEKQEEELYSLKEFVSLLCLKIPVFLYGQSEKKELFVSWSRWIDRIRLVVPEELSKKIFFNFSATQIKANGTEKVITMPSVYVKKYPKNLSVSEVKNLIECPYKFFWISLFGVREHDYFKNSSDHREVGLGLHLLMENIENTLKEPIFKQKKILSHKDWYEILKRTLYQLVKNRNVSLETALTIRSRFNNLSDWCLSHFENFASFMVEKNINANLPDFAINLSGKVDRVATMKRDTDYKSVIDFKTTQVGSTKKEIFSAQILLYAWLLKKNGIKISNAGYVSITNKETKFKNVEQIDKAEMLVNKLNKVFLDLNEGLPIQPIAAKFGKVCKECRVKAICRKDEWMS